MDLELWNSHSEFWEWGIFPIFPEFILFLHKHNVKINSLGILGTGNIPKTPGIYFPFLGIVQLYMDQIRCCVNILGISEAFQKISVVIVGKVFETMRFLNYSIRKGGKIVHIFERDFSKFYILAYSEIPSGATSG